MSNKPKDFLIAEYSSLRSSIDTRIQQRNKIVGFAIAVFGVTVGSVIGTDVPLVVISIYPFLAMFLALEWAHIDKRISMMAFYLRTQVESELKGEYKGWYSFFNNPHRKKETRLNVVAAIGVFSVFSVLAAVGVLGWGELGQEFITGKWLSLLGIADLVAALVAFLTLFKYRKFEDIASHRAPLPEGSNSA